jgi:hypothetical protein
MEKTRIATINQGSDAGKRYVVQRMHFGKGGNDPDKVYCWGEVVKVVQKGRALQTTHASDSRTFLASAVTVTEVDRTPELLDALFRQHIDGLRAKGHVLEQRGRTVVDHGTPEQAERRREANEHFMAYMDEAGLGALLRGRRRR